MRAPLREVREGRADELEELVHSVRRELERRGERLPVGWTAEAVEDLRGGRLTGWYRPAGAEGGEIGFYSRRAGRVFAHVHVLPGPEAEPRAAELVSRIAEDPGLHGLALNVGTSGLSGPEERALAEEWTLGAGREIVRREGLERSATDAGALDLPDLGSGFAAVAVREITEPALADLDQRGFSGSPDESLFAGDEAEFARMIRGILDGRLGPFLDDASVGLLAPDGRLAGFLLSAELSPRVGLFADLVVDPALRRRGLGRYLLTWGLRALRALGYGSAQLWVTEGNTAARALYDALGFRPFASTLILHQAEPPAVAHPQALR